MVMFRGNRHYGDDRDTTTEYRTYQDKSGDTISAQTDKYRAPIESNVYPEAGEENRLTTSHAATDKPGYEDNLDKLKK